MPVVNWRTTGSFPKPVTPPAAGPLEGELIQLPCINRDWLLLIMGCLEQLRVPSIWSTASDAATDSVLFWVTQLQEIIWGAMAMGCCDVAMRFTEGCVLQFSTDGGATFTDVSGWSDNWATCVQQASYPTGLPPNPLDQTHNQLACSIADYLAIQLIQVAMQHAADAQRTSLSLVQFAVGVAESLAFAFPIVSFGVGALGEVYSLVTSSNLADFDAALADGSFWDSVRCAIYDAIVTDGYVTDANFSTIVSNITAISYAHSEVVSALASFVSGLGAHALEMMQQGAGLETSADCSGCTGTSGWCYRWDTSGHYGDLEGDWTTIGGLGTYVAGQGWTSIPYPSDPTSNVLAIEKTGWTSTLISVIHVFYYTQNLPSTGTRSIVLNGTTIASLSSTPGFADTYVDPVVFGDAIAFHLDTSEHPGPNYIYRIDVLGGGTNPFGTTNCPTS